MSVTRMDRREVCRMAAGAALGLSPMGRAAMAAEASAGRAAGRARFRLRYILASCMYGKTKLAEIVPDLRRGGAEHLDVWPAKHGDQREQIEAMGHDAFRTLLEKHRVKLGIITRFDLGPFRLQDEMKVARKFGARMLVCGSGGPGNLEGAALKTAIRKFVEKLEPHLAAAEASGVTLAVENHANALICSPDSLSWFAEMAGSKRVGIALAPYHLEQDAKLIARIIDDLGPKLVHFYAWQHGMGCHRKLPKEQELLQMPGRGTLDFTPILAALAKIDYKGWTEIFMHPVPRGIPILETTAKATDEINRARQYLERCLANLRGKTS